MRGSAAKARRQIAKEANQAAVALAAPISAALQNEALTRQRVDALEAFHGRNLLGRLRWLVTGK